MKVALLLSGEPRFAELAGSLFWRDISDEYEVDVFIHSWTSNSRKSEGSPPINLSFPTWKPKRILVGDKQAEFNSFQVDMDMNKFMFMFGQMISFKRVCELFEPYKDEYDLILKIRMDSFLKPDTLNNLHMYMDMDREFHYWEIPDKIFVEGCHFERNRLIISDYSFVTMHSSAMLKFAKNIDVWVKQQAMLNDPQYYHHTAWHDIATQQGVNIVPLRIGAKVVADSPMLETAILRPGIERYPMDAIDWETVKQVEIDYHNLCVAEDERIKADQMHFWEKELNRVNPGTAG